MSMIFQTWHCDDVEKATNYRNKVIAIPNKIRPYQGGLLAAHQRATPSKWHSVL